MIKPDQHNRAMEIFDRVCDLSAEQRELILREACAGEPELRRQVEALLRADQTNDDLLDDGSSDLRMQSLAAGLMDEFEQNPSMPEQIQGYRIVRKIGEGGMGIIYEAEQDSPRRRVALKLLRPGMIGRNLLRRFQREADVLGQLQHPGIAQVIEAGVADLPRGRQPYFVMEMVDGQMLDRFADQHELNLPQRLELLARICDAVQHAHQKGIIHRDLKPSNVILASTEHAIGSQTHNVPTTTDSSTSRDNVGQPKVLDFGIARVTDADIQTVTVQTEVGQLIGTLAYMSPEQVAGDSTDLDTRCDVYALGVMLYELLARHRPHDLAGLPIPEAARVIRETEPARLGTFDRAFKGDIETIVAKAMEIDRDRRYSSAAELAADIRRFLSNEPIIARPATTVYQLKKFARRNRGLVAGLVMTFVVLILGMTGTLIGWTSTLNANTALESTNQQLEDANNGLKQVTEFFGDTLAAASPKEQGKDVSVREVMDKAANEIGEQFSNLPFAEAKIRQTIGRTYMALGEYVKAEKQLVPALERWSKVQDADEAEILDTRELLATVHYYQGERGLAAEEYESVLESTRNLLGPNDPRLIPATGNVAFIRMQSQQFDEAEQLFLEAQSLQDRVGKAESSDAIDLKANLAMLYTRMGRGDEAIPIYTEAINLSKRVRGKDHPETLLVMANLASLYVGRQQSELAIPLLEKVLEEQRRVLGGGHRQTLITLNNLASILQSSGRLADAEIVLKQGLTDAQQVYADDAPSVLFLKHTLGTVLRLMERFDEAEAIVRSIINASTAAWGAESQRSVHAKIQLSYIHFDRSEFDLAAQVAENALELVKRSDWAVRHQILLYTEDLAEIYIASHRFEEAEQLLMDLYVTAETNEIPKIAQLFIDLYEAWNRPDDAGHWRKQAGSSDGR